MILLKFIVPLFLIWSVNPKPVKTMTKWVVDKNGKKIHKEEEKEYNIKGDVIKWIQYVDKMDPLCESFNYEYAGKYKSKEVRSNCNNIGGHVITNYTYDKLGRVIQEAEYFKSKLQRKTVIHYIGNTNNKRFSETIGFNEKTSYEYYPNNLLKKDVQTVGGSWFGSNEYKYDKDKHLIYQGSEVDGGVGLVKYYFTYQNGILVKDIVNVPDTGIEYHIYEYTYYKMK